MHWSSRFCRVCGAVREEVALLHLLRLPTSAYGSHYGVCHVRPLLCCPLKGDVAATLGNQSQLKPLGTLSAISVCVKACSETHPLVGLSQHKGHCMAELKVG